MSLGLAFEVLAAPSGAPNGQDEASIKDGRISISSPIARGLIGKYARDAVEVQTPGGLKRYEILDVRYE